jgi:EMAP domain
MTENKITIEDFIKLDLRIGTIVEAEEVEDSRKMLKLRINLGEDTRTVFAGIKKSYSPDGLLDKQVIVIANLMPREMKFGVSDGYGASYVRQRGNCLISP